MEEEKMEKNCLSLAICPPQWRCRLSQRCVVGVEGQQGPALVLPRPPPCPHCPAEGALVHMLLACEPVMAEFRDEAASTHLPLLLPARYFAVILARLLRAHPACPALHFYVISHSALCSPQDV